MKLEYFNINEIEPDNKSAMAGRNAYHDDDFDNKSLFERRIGNLCFNQDGSIMQKDKGVHQSRGHFDCSKSQMVDVKKQRKVEKKNEEEAGFVLYDGDGPRKDDQKSMHGAHSSQVSKNKDSEVKHSSGSKILQNRPPHILIEDGSSRKGNEPQTTMNIKMRNSVVLGSSASYSMQQTDKVQKRSRGESLKTDRELESKANDHNQQAD